MPGRDCADAPASKEGAQQIVTVAENRQIVYCGELEVMANIEIRVSLVQDLGTRLELLGANVVRGSVNRVAPRIRSREAQARAELVRIVRD